MAEPNPYSAPQVDPTGEVLPNYRIIEGGLRLLAIWLAIGAVGNWLNMLAHIATFGLETVQQLPALLQTPAYLRMLVGAVCAPLALLLLYRRSRYFPPLLFAYELTNCLLMLATFRAAIVNGSPDTKIRGLVFVGIALASLATCVPYAFRSERARKTLVR